jgi:hypothetical protein
MILSQSLKGDMVGAVLGDYLALFASSRSGDS